MQAQSALQAEAILRNPDTFQWYVISFFALIALVYFQEIEKKNMKVVFAGLAFWGMDWINEILNSLIYRFTGFAPLWGAPGKTAWLILVGLNIEILFMFAISGIGYVKLLPADKNKKILGINNRLFFASVNSAFCVVVEMLLSHFGYLTWEYSFWSIKFPFLVWLFGYMPFNVVCFWVYDMESTRKQATFVGIQWAIIALALLTLIPMGVI